MSGPRDIIRRAVVSKKPPTPVPRMPAPVQMGQGSAAKPAAGQDGQLSQWRTPPLMPRASGVPEKAKPDREPDAAMPPAVERVPVAQNIGGHAVYRELMRSHDRMGTRHVPKGE